MHSNEKSPHSAALFLVCACGATLVLSMACGKSGSRSSDAGPENQAGAGTGGAAGSARGGSAQSGERGGSGGTPASGGTVGDAGEGGEGTDGGAPNGGLGGSLSTGGAVSAGSPAGGNSSAGMAGSGGLPPLPLPDGCEARSGSESERSCELAVLCRTDARINTCSRLTAERWQCDCGRGRTYEIEGAEGLLACAVMAEVCPVIEPEGEPSCSERFEQSDTDSCELEEACGRSVDVTQVSGARAWLMEYGGAYCGRSDSRVPFECSCFDGNVGHDYALLSESGDDACRPLLDFCWSGATPSYDGATRCFDTAAEESVYGCLLNQACATPMRLTDDVSLARVETWWSRCDPMQPAGARCYCSDESKGFEFDVTQNPLSPTCASAMLNCTDDLTVERRGSVECEPNSQSAGQDYCNADLGCSQPATVNGREIVARGPMMVRCGQRRAGEGWWCSCASAEDSTIFELGTPSATGWEACTAAIERCEDVLPFFIGPSGGDVYPPDPLPPE